MRGSMAMVALLLTAGSAAAQTTRSPERPVQEAPPALERKACAEHNVEGQGDAHETQGRAPADGSLSEKLAQSGGVICPPRDLDPDIRAPAPGGGEMPVLPPPAGQNPQSPK